MTSNSRDTSPKNSYILLTFTETVITNKTEQKSEYIRNSV